MNLELEQSFCSKTVKLTKIHPKKMSSVILDKRNVQMLFYIFDSNKYSSIKNFWLKKIVADF